MNCREKTKNDRTRSEETEITKMRTCVHGVSTCIQEGQEEPTERFMDMDPMRIP